MARTSKKRNDLTPEEKLAQALVPDVEQPYRIPANWCWSYLTSGFAKCKDGYRKPVNADERSKRVGSIPYYGATGQVGWIDDYLTDEELVLLGEDGAPFLDLTKDKAYLITGKAWVNNHAHILKSFFGHIGNLYLLHYLNIFNYLDYVNGTTRLKLTQSSMDTIPVPLPPLAEQHRIVDRIESLFAKLDEAKEKAQAVIDGYEDRKAAILHKAFTGGLTEEWRKEAGLISNTNSSWEMHSLGEYANSQYGYTEKASEEQIGPHFLRITDIQDGQVLWKSVPYCRIDNTLKKKYSLAVGDIVVARTGATTGKSYMVIDEVDAVYASYLIRVSIHKKELLLSKYLYYFLQCPFYWQQITELSSGIAQPGVNGNKLETLRLPIPDITEQNKVVEILDNILPLDRQARDSAGLVLDQIDSMKKSILVRAFRGELGTNDPTDEPAIELLKRVL